MLDRGCVRGAARKLGLWQNANHLQRLPRHQIHALSVLWRGQRLAPRNLPGLAEACACRWPTSEPGPECAPLQRDEHANDDEFVHAVLACTEYADGLRHHHFFEDRSPQLQLHSTGRHAPSFVLCPLQYDCCWLTFRRGCFRAGSDASDHRSLLYCPYAPSHQQIHGGKAGVSAQD